jgi:ParB family transcriptional regulator, chromosome partitioning protein
MSDLAAAERSFLPPGSRPEVAPEPSGPRVVQISLDSAEPNRFQPRRTFDEVQLNELAASIRSAGVVQPILVRAGPPGHATRYEIVAGERRWRACKLAGLTHVPALVATLTDEQSAEWALVENIQRADLSPMERAWAVRGLAERFGLSHAQIGDKLGIDRSTAANLSRLTELEKEIHDLLDSGQISAGHGKVLVGMNPGPVRIGLAKQAANQGWSVRRLEQAAARAAQAPTGAAPDVKIGEGAIAKAAAMKDLERQLGEHLGTSVRIRASAGGKRGSLVIKFFDLDHFDGLMSKIGFVLR